MNSKCMLKLFLLLICNRISSAGGQFLFYYVNNYRYQDDLRSLKAISGTGGIITTSLLRLQSDGLEHVHHSVIMKKAFLLGL